MRNKRLLLLLALLLSLPARGQERPNVLFIAVDDLNDWVGCLQGHPQTMTPHIDRLASAGMLFTNAHCQAPICGPSRASIMTGLHPSTSGNYLQVNDPEIKLSNEATRNAIFLPDYFEQNGYRTMGVGKIYHNGDAAQTFDQYGGVFEKFGPKPAQRMKYDPAWYGKPGSTQTDWGPFPDEDSKMPDFKSAAWAIDKLNQDHDSPFFLAVGLIRPHVPWHVPAPWFEPFPLDEIVLPPYLPGDLEDLPEMALRVSDAPMMPTTELLIEKGQWKEVIQAYLACVHFVDAQIGKVLNALENSRYSQNTIVVLWSDHGYHLGEKNRFAKQSLWQRDTRTVLVIKVPGQEDARYCNRPVQLVDIYPTLLELCGLPPNRANEGHSLVPLLEDPVGTPWPHAALSFFGKENVAVSGVHTRLIRYADGSREYYDLQTDPHEWTNLAGDPRYEKEIRLLEKQIPARQAGYSPYLRFTFNEYFSGFDEEQ